MNVAVHPRKLSKSGRSLLRSIFRVPTIISDWENHQGTTQEIVPLGPAVTF